MYEIWERYILKIRSVYGTNNQHLGLQVYKSLKSKGRLFSSDSLWPSVQYEESDTPLHRVPSQNLSLLEPYKTWRYETIKLCYKRLNIVSIT